MENKFKEKLLAGKTMIGTEVDLCDPCITEMVGQFGYDYIWIDTEHSAMDYHTVLMHVIAAKAAGSASMVRVPWNEPYLAKYDMDIVGFIINSKLQINEEIMAAYAKIAPVGSFHNDITTQLVVYNDTTVYMHLMNEIIPSGDDFTPRQMYEYLMTNGTNFAAYRAVNKSPTSINEAIDKFIAYAAARHVTVKCVDPYTLFDLVLQSGQGEYIYGE